MFSVRLGGSLPILIAYYSEFIPRPSRVKFLCALMACWAIGGIYVALMAWAILPKTGLMVVLDGQEHFSAWHIFMIVCAIPTPLAVIGLLTLPESPRILLQIGHEREALVIYQRIFGQNHPKMTVDEYKVSETDLPSSSQQRQQGRASSTSPTGPQGNNTSSVVRQKSIFSVLSYTLVNVTTLIAKIFSVKHRRATLPLLATWIFASFGYYGLSLWFTEYVKYLKGQDYQARVTTLTDASFADARFNQSIENMVYVNGRFTNVRFEGLMLNHVVFDSCTFEHVSFTQIKSSRSFFRNSTLIRSSFVDTDFFPYRFEDCRMEETTFNGMDAYCPLDFDYNIFLGHVFLEQLISEVALIPGLILAALLMDRFGRVRLIGLSFFLCSLLTLTLAAVRSPEAVIMVEAAFNAVFSVGFVSLSVASTETCPTSIRATGWGLINTLSRGAGLAGLFVYDSMLEISVLATCFVTSGVLLTAALLSILMVETRHKLL